MPSFKMTIPPTYFPGYVIKKPHFAIVYYDVDNNGTITGTEIRLSIEALDQGTFGNSFRQYVDQKSLEHSKNN